MAKQQDPNSLGAMMAAQNELASLNAGRLQNSQAEQAFLQQQQAANAVMMQAAQIGASGGVGQQVGAMNPQTQAILAQYGITGAPAMPGKTTSTSKTTQSGGNVKIENNTTTNNDIKIVNPGSGGGNNGAGNQAKFQTWLSNAFAKQGQEYEVQRRAFARRDRDLEKQSNKMMRALEKSTKGLSEKLNPENWQKVTGNQTKTFMTVLLLSLAPILVDPIVKGISGLGDRIKSALGIEKNQTMLGGITELISNQLSIWQEKSEVKFRERAKLVKELEPPKKGNLITNPSGWMSYLSNCLTTLFGGVSGAKQVAYKEHDKNIVNSLVEGSGSAGTDSRTVKDLRDRGQSYFSTGSSLKLNTNVGDLFDKTSGKLKKDGGIEAQARLAARASQIITSKSGTLNTGELSNIMSSIFTEAEKMGMTNLGKEADARAFVQSMRGNWDELVKKNYIIRLEEKIIYYYKERGKTTYDPSPSALGVKVKTGEEAGVVGIKTIPKDSNETTSKELYDKGFRDEIISSYYITHGGLIYLQDNLRVNYGLDELDLSNSASSFSLLNNLQAETRKSLHPELNSFVNTLEDAEVINKFHRIEGIEKETANLMEKIDSRDGAVKRLKDANENRKWVKQHRGSVIITSKFNEGRDGYNHGGVDIDVEKGDSIYSAGNGVITVGEDSRSGKYVKILHPDGTETFYCHLDKNDYFNTGDKVSEGDVIGLGGNTGHCVSSGGGDGSHLHYEVREKQEDGSYKNINPESSMQYNYLKTLVPQNIKKVDGKEIKKTAASAVNILPTELTEIPKIEEIYNISKGKDGKEIKTLTGLKQQFGAFEINYDPTQAYLNPNSSPSSHISSIMLNGASLDKNSPEYVQLLEKIDKMYSKKAYPGIYTISDKQMVSRVGLDSKEFETEWVDLGEFGWSGPELEKMNSGARYEITNIYNNKVWFKFSTNKLGELLQVRVDMSLETGIINPATNQYYKTGTILRNWAGFNKEAYDLFYPLHVPENMGDYNPAFFSLGVLMPKEAEVRLTTKLISVKYDVAGVVNPTETMTTDLFELGLYTNEGNITEAGQFIHDWNKTPISWENPIISGNYDRVKNMNVRGNKENGFFKKVGNHIQQLENPALDNLSKVAQDLGRDIIVIGKDVVASAKTGWYEGQGMAWKVGRNDPATWSSDKQSNDSISELTLSQEELIRLLEQASQAAPIINNTTDARQYHTTVNGAAGSEATSITGGK